MRHRITIAAALLALAAFAAGTGSAATTRHQTGRTWFVTAGAQARVANAKHGVQVAEYLPSEVWIDAGDSVVWNVPTGEPHTHRHVHPPLVHEHPHYPDLHHRHRHSNTRLVEIAPPEAAR